jgi:hypothetical protein
MAPRIVIAGYLVRFPLGGYAWQALHFLLGFRSLGCEVFFYEDTGYYAEAYVPGEPAMVTAGYAHGIDYTDAFFGAHGCGDAWAFWDAGADRWHGAGRDATHDALARADLVVNLGGVNRLQRAASPRARSVYVDLDPAYTQLRLHAGDRRLRALVGDHDLHFTFGENIGRPGCRIPTGDIAWQPLRQPIVASLWQPLPPAGDAAYSTIGKWDSAGRDVMLGTEVFSWRKRTEWLRFVDLPRLTGERFRIAMDVASHPDDYRRLSDAGWEIVDPLVVSSDPDAYRDFIRTSKGEFTVAKDVNVRLASGWFSDRGACYLAAGRPVVNQDTGFAPRLPAGSGLLAFRDLESALAAFDELATHYDRHRAAARTLALEQFAPERVLAPMLAALR